MPPLPERGPLFSPLEYAPDYLIYALHPFYGLWLTLRYRGATLPAICNPTILTGGIAGESKTDMFALLGSYARSFFAPFVTVAANAAPEDIRARLSAEKLSYPLVAKPDIGRNGRGVKIVENETALLGYLARFPAAAKMVLQRYVGGPGEAGVFYVRKPSEATGRITSLTLKYFPSVVGDGVSTLRELIERDPRASRIARIYFRRHKEGLDRIVPAGEEHRLVSVGNHVRGSLFINGAEHVTPAMTEAFDRISKDIRGFYFGRFDVRFADIEDLKRGRGFTIIEYNGASSEPTHVWDRRTGVWETYRGLLEHWRLAYEVGAEVRRQGVARVPLSEILRVRKAEVDLIDQYPDEE